MSPRQRLHECGGGFSAIKDSDTIDADSLKHILPD
jgi:hypothetical protein